MRPSPWREETWGYEYQSQFGPVTHACTSFDITPVAHLDRAHDTCKLELLPLEVNHLILHWHTRHGQTDSRPVPERHGHNGNFMSRQRFFFRAIKHFPG
jgi:hypothetical protein